MSLECIKKIMSSDATIYPLIYDFTAAKVWQRKKSSGLKGDIHLACVNADVITTHMCKAIVSLVTTLCIEVQTVMTRLALNIS